MARRYLPEEIIDKGQAKYPERLDGFGFCIRFFQVKKDTAPAKHLSLPEPRYSVVHSEVDYAGESKRIRN